MGELCFLGHKIITNLLWDVLAMGVAVYLIKVYKAGKTRYTRTLSEQSRGHTRHSPEQGMSERAAPPEAKDDRQQKLLV